jgi:hypothetical protein
VWVAEPPAPPGTPAPPAPSRTRLGGWRVTLLPRGEGEAAPPPLALLDVCSGRFACALPAAAAAGYAVGEPSKCVTPALAPLEARWPGLVGAVPQLVPSGEPQQNGHDVVATYEYVECKRPLPGVAPVEVDEGELARSCVAP